MRGHTIYLPFSNTTLVALMHGHVNEWHSVKARNKHGNLDLSMLNDKQKYETEAKRLIEPITYERS